MALFSDLQLDSTTHDLLVTTDLTILDTTDAITQRLKIGLLTFQGEWFLNTASGTPYYQVIFVKGVSKAIADTTFRDQILGTEGVLEILTFSSTLDAANREYTLSFSCRAATGDTIILEI